MLRLPAVSGAFYPAEPHALTALIHKYVSPESLAERKNVRACLVPHAGYIYSGAIAGAVFAHISLPKRIIILGVRHFPYGEDAAMLSRGVWRTKANIPSKCKFLSCRCSIPDSPSFPSPWELSITLRWPRLAKLWAEFSR